MESGVESAECYTPMGYRTWARGPKKIRAEVERYRWQKQCADSDRNCRPRGAA